MIYRLFSTREREKILEYIFDNPSKAYRVRDIAKTLSISVGTISGFFAFLKRNNILKRSGNNFYVNIDNPLTKTLKIILNVERIDITILKKIPSCAGIGIYGSWANGTNKEDSDIDIWVRVEKKPGEEIIAKISSRMKKRMKRNVQLLIIDPEKNGLLRDNDPIFYYSLIYGSVVLYGKSLED